MDDLLGTSLGVFIGGLSTLMGIGGGTLSVPLLNAPCPHAALNPLS